MSEIVSLAAILACTLFAGAAIYINLVEHPARLACGTEIAAKQWAPSYKRATVMQASLAMIAAAAGAARWVQSLEGARASNAQEPTKIAPPGVRRTDMSAVRAKQAAASGDHTK